jgi:hypothetical protein
MDVDDLMTGEVASLHVSRAGTSAAGGDELAHGLARWLFSGAVAHTSGAIAAWRDLKTGRLGYEYPEITGYFLTLASALGLTGTEPARRAAAWLMERHRDGQRHSRSTEPGVVYTFDTVVQGTGLLNFGRAERCDSATALGADLVLCEARRVLDRGVIEPLAEGSASPPRARTWSTCGRLHLLKAVQGFCLADECTGSGTGSYAAQVLVARYTEEIRIVSDHLSDAGGRYYLHPFCYALEGLWAWSSATDDGEAVATAGRHLQELVEHRLPGRGMPGVVASGHAQLDVTAQVARLGTLLAPDATWLPEIFAFLRAEARATGDGGYYMPYRAGEPHFESSWPSMFTLQALRAVAAPLDWRHLV